MLIWTKPRSARGGSIRKLKSSFNIGSGQSATCIGLVAANQLEESYVCL